MAMNIMIQGTMSNAGKSLLAAGLCRVLKQDGYRVAPFKSQNMALNSFITKDGGEMGRAQVVQAEAAGIEPDTRMNPILLKPTTDVGSQVIVNGQVRGNMQAMEYFRRKRDYLPAVLEAYNSLAAEYDVIVIEGAGSPAEINLKQDDIVNMGLAKLVDAPVLLVGDIDRGGVFAQLYGTVALLEEDERRRIKGVVVNKFRGDRAILEPGLKTLEQLCGIPVAGVIPYTHIDIDDEDSLTERFDRSKERKLLDIAVIRVPRISNFTDFSPFERYENVSLRYVDQVSDLHQPDMILLPGTKSTIADLRWLRQSGLEAAILKAADAGTLVFGICGGYQMLGQSLSDPEGVEDGGSMKGLGLLPVTTTFTTEKTRTRVNGTVLHVEGNLKALENLKFEGYEIHMGKTELLEGCPMNQIHDTVKKKDRQIRDMEPENRIENSTDGISHGNVYGTYIHGIFDKEKIVSEIVKSLAEKKGLSMEEVEGVDLKAFKESQYDLLADTLRKHLDMKAIYQIMGMQK